jgi:hypothetical protein
LGEGFGQGSDQQNTYRYSAKKEERDLPAVSSGVNALCACNGDH